MKRLVVFFAASLLLTGCFEKEDPFVRLPEEETTTLSGEVFPFSVSVATNATHRLESNNKLVAYLASEIVELKEFEGQEVEVDGVLRSEKMREILWVDAVRLVGVEPEAPEAITEERFITKRFTFVFPIDWEYSLSPDGTAYFLDKNDPARRVFLTFSVKDVTKADRNKNPNTLIANLAGIENSSTDEFNRERQNVTLFSNLYEDVKYEFLFTHSFEEFEKKKAFFKLLNSFIEGEENVIAVKKDQQKKLAAKEAAKLKKIKIEAANAQAAEKTLEGEKESEEKEAPEPTAEISKTPDSPAVPTAKMTPPSEGKKVDVVVSATQKDYTNLNDARSFTYTNEYFNFVLKVPYGYWFRNFGEGENNITQIGFGQRKLTDASKVDFWIHIVKTDTPVAKTSERQIRDDIEVTWPRDGQTAFVAKGPLNQRNAILSVLSSYGTLK